ncbi:MAG: glycosyltransferase family 2 protein [Patescibacteria group bacterium]
MIDVSFIIVNFNNAGLTRECVKNLKNHATRATREIIVVDNSNDNALAEILALRYPDVRYIPQIENVGFGKGNNVGIAHASGRYIALTNYDSLPLPGALDTLLAYMDAHHDVGIAAPQLLNPNGSVQQSYYRFPALLTPVYRRLIFGRMSFGKKHLDSFLMRDVPMDHAIDVDWALGAFLFIRKSALDLVGVFDERFFLYLEDTDLCRRFWAQGFTVRYLPQARMLHLHLRDSANTMGIAALRNKTTRIHLASAIKYFLKWGVRYATKT